MPELLFEIGVEELPALAIEPAQGFMTTFFRDRFKELRIDCGSIEAKGTPRRLVVMIDGIAPKQADFEEEILGPNVAIAFEADGKLSKAGIGFVRSKGIDESQIYRKKVDKGEVIAARKVLSGQLVKDLLPELFLELLRTMPFKKRMRWDDSGENFARPVRWLVAVFDNEPIDFSFADVRSGQHSRGHRFMAPEPFLVTNRAQYLEELKKRYVVLSSEEREAMFLKSAQEKLDKLGAEFRRDDDLMATVRNLMEYPFAVLGRFEDEYLRIPEEILICEMKSHQKCFAVYDRAGRIMPYFICSAGTKPFDEEVFAKGNGRVLRARFEDGAFYFAEDQKKTLRDHAAGLSGLIFERELGTVFDKSLRIEQVALKLAEFFGFSAQEMAIIKKAAPILKADLVTGVVGQFPELEGTMGRIYAQLNGEDHAVGEAIESHYWPRFAEDRLPKSRVSALFSIADKLDTLVGIIGIGKKPTGNKDPFALRRSAIGIIRMLVNFGLNIDVEVLIEIARASYGNRFQAKSQAIDADAKEFIIQRARGILIDNLGREGKEYAVNFADSVLSQGASNFMDVFARAETLFAMHNQSKDEFLSIVQAFKRASNIVKKAMAEDQVQNLNEHNAKVLTSPSEKDLLDAVKNAKIFLDQTAKTNADYEGLRSSYLSLFSQVAMIKPKLDGFFDNVMVMVDDDNLRNARLALLGEIKKFADRIADFTHL